MPPHPHRPSPAQSALDEVLNRLSDLGHRRATDLGHELSHWTPPPGEEELALRAYCKRCRRTIYVRAERGLEGIAGSAARERCG
jgi:hypothetical protein